MSIASDFRPIEQGFSEPASPEMPLPQAAEMPMDGADAALSQQAVGSELASEGADEPVVTEEQMAWLRKQNWATPEDLSNLRSKLDSQIRQEREAALAAKREAQTVQTTNQTIINWLQQKAEQYGIDESEFKELNYLLRDKQDEVAGQYQQTDEQARETVKGAVGEMFNYLQRWSKPTDGGDPLFKIDDPRFQPIIKSYGHYAYQAQLTGDPRAAQARDAARDAFLDAVQKARDESLMARLQGTATTEPQQAAPAPAQRRGPQNTGRGGGAASSDFKSVLESMKQQHKGRPYDEIYAEAWAAWERQ